MGHTTHFESDKYQDGWQFVKYVNPEGSADFQDCPHGTHGQTIAILSGTTCLDQGHLDGNEVCFFLIVVYVFAVAFRQTTEGTATGDKYFRNVPEAMRTLLLDGVIPDLADFMNQVGKESIWYALFLMVFILLASVTVMNMLIGVLVQVVSVVSSVESEQMKVNFVKQRLMRMLNLNEADLRQEDMYISRKEFEMLLTEPEGAKAMQDIGVDPVGLVDFGDYIFSKGTKGEGRRKGKGDAGDYISFGKFIEIMLQFRGTNTCTVRDIVDMRKVMSYEMQESNRAGSES